MANVDALVAEALVYVATGDSQVTNANMALWWARRQDSLVNQARWWFMLGSQNLSVTLAGGIGPYTPTGTPMFIQEVLYSATPLPQIPWSQGQIIYPTTGAPQAYDSVAAASAGALPATLYVFPAPDATYTLNLWTYNRPAELTYGTTQTNIFTDNFPRLVVAGMCWSAFERLEDSRNIAIWKSNYESELLPLLQYQQEASKKALFSTPRPAYGAVSVPQQR